MHKVFSLPERVSALTYEMTLCGMLRQDHLECHTELLVHY